MRATVMLVLACACQPSPRELRSGTRLKVEWIESGGMKVFYSLADTAFDGHRCSYSVASDGRYRCLPHTAGAIVFRDDTCTDPLAHFEPPFPRDTAFAADFEGWTGWATYATRDEVQAPVVYRKWSDGTCDDERVFGGDRLFTVTAIPADRFVAGQRGTMAIGKRLQRVVTEGEDGSRILEETYDERNRRVWPYLPSVSEGAAAAWASELAYASVDRYADPACEVPLYIAGTGAAVEGKRALFTVADGACERALFGLYVVEGAYDGPFFGLEDGACVERPRPNGDPHSVRAADASELVWGTLRWARGDRLARLELVNDDGSVGPDVFNGRYNTLFDTVLGTTCAFQETPTGDRCVPRDPPGRGYYSDDKCTVGMSPASQCRLGESVGRDRSGARFTGYFRYGEPLGRMPWFAKMGEGSLPADIYLAMHGTETATPGCLGIGEGEAVAIEPLAIEDFALGTRVRE
ncbi:MAG: hypothetical protein IT381_25155 [Deltaproteobacteria bacterium]|nr:hypothetical protein [Deltaproteobacteria bacterium]